MRRDTISRIFGIFSIGFLIGYVSRPDYIQPLAQSRTQTKKPETSSHNPISPPCECASVTPPTEPSTSENLHDSIPDIPPLSELREKMEKDDLPNPVSKERFLKCFDTVPQPYIQQHGRFYVSYNTIPARKYFRCDETITLSTHGEINFLHNLIPLVERWKGPISIALYAPNSDYDDLMFAVKYLRDCTSAGELIKDFVSFHFYFPNHMVSQFFPYWKWSHLDASPADCPTLTDEILHLKTQDIHRHSRHLLYPINVARNIAKEGATTALVLYTDIEMLPSEGLIPKFLAMLELYRVSFQTHDSSVTKNVFVLPAFVISPQIPLRNIPLRKPEMLNLIQTARASLKHTKAKCSSCNTFTGFKEWIQAEPIANGSEISILMTTRRTDPALEPYFIGFKTVPFWDERLKLTDNANLAQASLLCLQDYTFHVLDGAFLVHTSAPSSRRREARDAAKTNELFQNVIQPEMFRLLGENTDCYYELEND